MHFLQFILWNKSFQICKHWYNTHLQQPIIHSGYYTVLCLVCWQQIITHFAHIGHINTQKTQKHRIHSPNTNTVSDKWHFSTNTQAGGRPWFMRDNHEKTMTHLISQELNICWAAYSSTCNTLPAQNTEPCKNLHYGCLSQTQSRLL